jgi:ABC-type transport system involved in multi-copper enzyme maturation permease subunit
LLAWGFSIVLAVSAAFLAAPAIAADVESGLLLALLPRPLRRSDIVLGKWLGLAILLSGYTLVTAALEFTMIRMLSGYLPPHPLLATVFLVGESLVLMTLALWASTTFASMTGGVIGVAAFGIAWISGMTSMIASALDNQTLVHVGTVVSLLLPTDGLWRSAVYYLQPAAIIAVAGAAASSGRIAGPFGVTAPQPPAYIVWCIGWLIVVLGLAVRSFGRRDI